MAAFVSCLAAKVIARTRPTKKARGGEQAFQCCRSSG